jgi:hypothetical protein
MLLLIIPNSHSVLTLVEPLLQISDLQVTITRTNVNMNYRAQHVYHWDGPSGLKEWSKIKKNPMQCSVFCGKGKLGLVCSIYIGLNSWKKSINMQTSLWRFLCKSYYSDTWSKKLAFLRQHVCFYLNPPQVSEEDLTKLSMHFTIRKPQMSSFWILGKYECIF